MNQCLKTFFSRYHARHVRSLVYMLQQSEYRVRDYLRWFWRVRDFAMVEQRKSLVKTPKSIFFLGAGYLGLTFLYAFALWVVLVGMAWWKYLIFFILVLASPFILAYAMALFTFLVWLAQRPVESVILLQAKRRLRAHKGLRIAIAGSYGKTTMRELLKTVLSAGKQVAAPPASHNTPLGISTFISHLKGEEEVLIFELGEYYPGDVMKLAKLVEPNIGIITGVNEAHLEKFKDIERTRTTIFELADYLSSSPPARGGVAEGRGGGSVLYINGENALAKERAPASAIVYGREGVGGWVVTRPRTSLGGTSFVLKADSKEIRAQSKLLGLHQIGPLCVAAHIGRKLGLSPEEIEKGIADTAAFEHRLQPMTDAQGVTTIDDSYNGNPDGVRAVIEFLSSLKGSRRWYVTPGLVEMGKRKEAVHRDIGRQLAQAGIEKVVLIRNSVTPFIAEGLQEMQFQGELLWFDKAFDAFAALPHLTVKGDIVLLQNDWPDQYA